LASAQQIYAPNNKNGPACEQIDFAVSIGGERRDRFAGNILALIFAAQAHLNAYNAYQSSFAAAILSDNSRE
jgi:hypothetical protein